VSLRTVHRDMEALSAAGVPVYALRGARGGWQLDEGWRTQVPGLEEAELRALLMSQPRVLGDRRLADAAQRAIGKLLAALPPSMRDRAASIRQRLHVDTTGWRGVPEDLSMLPIVQDAVARDRQLQMTYLQPGHDPSERLVDPLGLVAKGSVWYLVAQTPAGLRTYRVSRIGAATVLDLPANRPPDFDLASYWTTSTEELKRQRQQYPVTLAVESITATMLCSYQRASIVQDATPVRAGWITLLVPFDKEDDAVFVVLGLGSRAEVIAPDSLRNRVVAEAAAIVERARGSAGVSRGETPT
jgi:predicted DNA-binding transcriptional regulator YafY